MVLRVHKDSVFIFLFKITKKLFSFEDVDYATNYWYINKAIIVSVEIDKEQDLGQKSSAWKHLRHYTKISQPSSPKVWFKG